MTPTRQQVRERQLNAAMDVLFRLYGKVGDTPQRFALSALTMLQAFESAYEPSAEEVAAAYDSVKIQLSERTVTSILTAAHKARTGEV